MNRNHEYSTFLPLKILGLVFFPPGSVPEVVKSYIKKEKDKWNPQWRDISTAFPSTRWRTVNQQRTYCIWCPPGWWAVVSGYEFLKFRLHLWQPSSEVAALTVVSKVVEVDCFLRNYGAWKTANLQLFRNNSWSSHLWRYLPLLQAKRQEFLTWDHGPPTRKTPYALMPAVNALTNTFNVHINN